MKKLLVAVLLISLLVFVGCEKKKTDSPAAPATETKTEAPAKADEKPAGEPKKVVATSTMLFDLVKVIGGDKVQVEGLMGPGVDPHLFKPSADDVNKLQTANLVIWNGLHLEAQLEPILEGQLKGVKTVAVGEAVPKESRLPFEESEFDPHIWFDIQNWKLVAAATKDALVELDPANKEAFEKNEADYQKQLDELEQWSKDQIAQIPEKSRKLITAHDAFNYFARANGFEVKGLQGISTESEATAKDVAELADYIVENNIKSIFVESSVPKKNVEAVQSAAKAKGVDVKIGGELFSDSLGDSGEEATYIGMIKANINTIVGALK